MIANTNPTALVQHKGVRQFVKFGIVGASSTVVNFSIFNVLYHLVNLNLFAALSTAFFISVINGFVWNRRWTFKESRGASAGSQSIKFFLVNVVAFVLNTMIVVLVIAHVTANGSGLFGQSGRLAAISMAILTGQGKKQFGFWLTNGALATSTCVVVFWNFFANRFWTFRN